MRVVRLEIPRETGALNRASAERNLDAFIPRSCSVQVEQDEAGAIAPSNVVDNLIEGLLAINRGVESQPVLKETQFDAELARSGELGLQIQVRTPEVVTVATVGGGLVLQRGTISVGARIFADGRDCCSHLTSHEATNAGERVGEDEARRERRVKERVTSFRDCRSPVVAASRVEEEVILPVQRHLSERTNQPSRSEERRVGKECRSRGSPYH